MLLDELLAVRAGPLGGGNVEQLKDNEPQRLALYKLAAGLVRAHANVASEMAEAGYTAKEATAIEEEVTSTAATRST